MIRLLVADDHPLILRGVQGLFDPAAYALVEGCADGLAAWARIEAGECDVAVLDLQMPGLSGLDILKRVRERELSVRIVLLTAVIEDDALVESMRWGVDGLVLKESAASLLAVCVQNVAAGRRWIDRDAMTRTVQAMASAPPDPGHALTERERDVAELVASGLRNKEVALRIHITEGTVKMHLHNIYEKLGIGSRTELTLHMRGLREESRPPAGAASPHGRFAG